MAKRKRKTSGRSTASRRKNRTQDRMPAGLITLFAGLVLMALAFVPGSSAWRTMHDVLFGVFGCGSFVLGAALCYLAILYTRGEDLLPHIAKLTLGLIFASGTVPGGTRSSGENGQLFAANVTIDYGTAIPTVTPDNTTIQYATLTKSYRGGWRSDTVDVIQGVYSDYGYSSGLSWNYGCMWFGNLRSVLSGATIKSATLTLYRKTGSGSGSAKTLYLCAVTNSSASGAPSIAANYGAIGTIGRGSLVTFSIPVAAVQGLASGAYGALCLYESPYNFGSSTYSNCYMRMAGTDSSYKPYLQVVYNSNGGAVG